MRNATIGFVVGFILALLCVGAVTTFTSVQGRGTYVAGYIIMPRCQADVSTLEGGSMCYDATTGDMVMKVNGTALRVVGANR